MTLTWKPWNGPAYGVLSPGGIDWELEPAGSGRWRLRGWSDTRFLVVVNVALPDDLATVQRWAEYIVAAFDAYQAEGTSDAKA